MQGYVNERKYEISKALRKANYAGVAWQIYMLSMVEKDSERQMYSEIT